jgi:chaperone LolA
MVKSISLKVFVVFLFASSIFGQSAQDVVKKIQNKFESIYNLTADFTQASVIPGSKSSAKNTGKIYFQKENKYRIEFKNMEIISDGATIWNYNKKAKKVIINSADDESNNLSLKNLIIDYPNQSAASLLGNEKINGQECTVVSLKPKNKESSFETMKIWSSTDGMVCKAEIIDNNKASLIFELSSIDTDRKISSDKFVFKKPAGIEVIDLR